MCKNLSASNIEDIFLSRCSLDPIDRKTYQYIPISYLRLTYHRITVCNIPDIQSHAGSHETAVGLLSNQSTYLK